MSSRRFLLFFQYNFTCKIFYADKHVCKLYVCCEGSSGQSQWIHSNGFVFMFAVWDCHANQFLFVFDVSYCHANQFWLILANGFEFMFAV